MRRVKKIVFVHFQPIEIYPPALNLLDFISSGSSRVKVYTTKTHLTDYTYFNPNIVVSRLNGSLSGEKSVTRLFKYFIFNIYVFSSLVLLSPSIIWYFESYSAMPVYWYLRLFRKKKKLFIHSHEYFSKEWYENGMKTVRYYHQKEKDYLFGNALVISQTNPYRVDLFLKDHPDVPATKMTVLPNFPPLRWNGYHRKIEVIKYPVKTVYIGSVSYHTTLIKEYCEWVVRQKGNVIFHIYSFNIDYETDDFIHKLNSEFIKVFPGGIAYPNIPALVNKNRYEVGIIFYKGLAENTIYCASNKLFEYLACGLDVWFPREMIGTYPYITEGTYPKVIKTDFERLEELDLEAMVSREGLTYKPSEYFAEKVYGEFIEKYFLHE